MGSAPIETWHRNLKEAARTAAKMADQGIIDVRVFNEAGHEVTSSALRSAWQRWAAGSGQGMA